LIGQGIFQGDQDNLEIKKVEISMKNHYEIFQQKNLKSQSFLKKEQYIGIVMPR